MNKDFRVNVDFIGHPKTLRLIRRFDHEALSYILRLWSYAAKYFPDGVFRDQDEEDLEIALGWKGEPGELIEALCDRKTRFLEKNGDGDYEIHDWEDHNGWAAHADERSENARKAAKAKWKKKQPSKDAESMRSACAPQCAEHAERNAEDEKIFARRNAPSPSPLPNPSPNPKPTSSSSNPENCEVGRGGKPKVVPIQKGASKKKPPDERMSLTEALENYCRVYCLHRPDQVNAINREKLRRLIEQYPRGKLLEDFEKAAKGNPKSIDYLIAIVEGNAFDLESWGKEE